MKKGLSIWIWMVVILTLLNVALIATIWLRPSLGPQPHVREHGRLIEELQLDETQRAQFNNLRLHHQRRIDSLKRTAKGWREQYFTGIRTGERNDSLAVRLGSLHQMIEEQTFKHFSDVRGLLTTNQKVIFDREIGRMIAHLPEQPHFRGDGQPPPGPPPPYLNDNKMPSPEQP